MRCIIIEDQPPAQRILRKFITDFGGLDLRGTFPDALQAMRFLQEQPIDLIFLDIHLPMMSGIDFLKTLAHPPKVILTTAFPDYALEGYELNVVDYLLKPFSFQRFVKAVLKAQSVSPAPPNPSASASQPVPATIFVKSGYEYLKLTLADIRYLHADVDYTEIVLSDRKVLSSDTLKHWEKELPADHFLRVHKSYIVHMKWIEKVAGNQIHLPAQQIIPIGRAYKETVFRKLVL